MLTVVQVFWVRSDKIHDARLKQAPTAIQSSLCGSGGDHNQARNVMCCVGKAP